MRIDEGRAQFGKTSLCVVRSGENSGGLLRGEIVRFRQISQAFGSSFRRDVTLGTGEKFVSDHEFLDRGGAKERREVVGMKMK
jgi:hypothetical protein